MPESSDPGQGEGELRELVVDVLERFDREGAAALEEACREHPHLAQRLRERVDALRELGLVGGDIAGGRIGEFRLIERIGAGGMGVVYRAEQEGLGREVALKLIRPEILGFARARERFERETAIVARLQHPSIVPIYTVGRDAERPYYAMELVRGCTLEQALGELEGRSTRELRGPDLLAAVRARSPAPREADDGESYLFEGTWEQVALRVTALIADALDHAHRRGVLHRDVKPGNVLITPAGRVLLVDFGLSQSADDDSLTRSGERVGSVHYMPPELLRGGVQRLDARSDVYSLGVLLYRLLTLERPFSGASEAAVMQAVLEGRPRPPREVAAEISWEAETVCLAAMDRDPERRYPTAAAFARDLSNALDRRPVEARRAGFWLRARRWVERRPGEAAAIALGAVLLVSVPSLFAWFQAREADRAEAALAEVSAEQSRTEEQRRLAEAEGLRAQENYALALATVDELLTRVAEERLDRVPGMVELRGELAQAAERAYARLQERQPDDPELARLAAGSLRLRATTSSLQGRREDACEMLRQAISLLEPLIAHGGFALQRQHALCLYQLGAIEGTPQHIADARARLRVLCAERPEDLRLREMLLRSSVEEVESARRSGDLDGADQHIVRLVADAEALALQSGSPEARFVLAESLRRHAQLLGNTGRKQESIEKYTRAVEICRELYQQDPSFDDARAGLAVALVGLSSDLRQTGRLAECRSPLDEAQPHLEWLAQAYPGEALYAHSLAGLYLNRGALWNELGDHEHAIEDLERAQGAYLSFERRYPELGSQDYQHGMVQINLAQSWSMLGDFERAVEVQDEALSYLRSAQQAAPQDPQRASWLGIERAMRGLVLSEAGRWDEAADVLAQAPALLGSRLDYLTVALEKLSNAVVQARHAGNAEQIRRTEGFARMGMEAALERGDAANLPALLQLQGFLDEP